MRKSREQIDEVIDLTRYGNVKEVENESSNRTSIEFELSISNSNGKGSNCEKYYFMASSAMERKDWTNRLRQQIGQSQSKKAKKKNSDGSNRPSLVATTSATLTTSTSIPSNTAKKQQEKIQNETKKKGNDNDNSEKKGAKATPGGDGKAVKSHKNKKKPKAGDKAHGNSGNADANLDMTKSFTEKKEAKRPTRTVHKKESNGNNLKIADDSSIVTSCSSQKKKKKKKLSSKSEKDCESFDPPAIDLAPASFKFVYLPNHLKKINTHLSFSLANHAAMAGKPSKPIKHATAHSEEGNDNDESEDERRASERLSSKSEKAPVLKSVAGRLQSSSSSFTLTVSSKCTDKEGLALPTASPVSTLQPKGLPAKFEKYRSKSITIQSPKTPQKNNSNSQLPKSEDSNVNPMSMCVSL
ncbi:hypothetical protein RFI_19626, partial [Reticulomyxa filosa]